MSSRICSSNACFVDNLIEMDWNGLNEIEMDVNQSN